VLSSLLELVEFSCWASNFSWVGYQACHLPNKKKLQTKTRLGQAKFESFLFIGEGDIQFFLEPCIGSQASGTWHLSKSKVLSNLKLNC